VKAITSIKGAVGSEQFIKECRSIQRDIIDDNIDQIRRKYSQITSMRYFSAAGAGIGLVGLALAGVEGSLLPAMVTGVAGAAASGIALAASEFKEKYGVRENPMHFLWRIDNNK